MILPKGSFKAKIIRSNFSNVVKVAEIMDFNGYCKIHGDCTDMTLVFHQGRCILGEGFPKRYSFEDIRKNFKDFIFDYDLYSFSDDEILETKAKNPGCTFMDFRDFSDDESSIFETELEMLDSKKIEDMKQNISKDIQNMLGDMDIVNSTVQEDKKKEKKDEF